MRVADIPRVMAIEERSFRSPWPAHAYEHELTKNELAHCYVLEGAGGELLGYGCLWLIVDEAHISTIAVPPGLRGRGLGELLLLALIDESFGLSAAVVTLEVRVSNQSARALYAKYGLVEVGQRKRYYDDGEDALIMTAGPIDAAYRSRLAELQAALFARLQANAGPDATRRVN